MSASSSSSKTLQELSEGVVPLPLPFASFSVKDSAHYIVNGIPSDRRIVLLGECTHGTEEFYLTRAEITKLLIEERGFSCVVFEADWPFMERANDFIHHKRHTPFEDQPRFPSWMWKNQCMQDFFDWCKERPSTTEINLLGMDCYSLFESKRAVIQFLEQHDPEFAEEVKSRLHYLDKFESGHQYADAVVNGSLRLIAQHIQDCLAKIQSRLQWGSDKYSCTPMERLSAEQNCEVLIAADEYYRKCVSEPSGSRASWNTRDQHMTTTLLRIDAHLKSPKIVVWAHNSHVGDSLATNRGGTGFERNETWNLGQMVRATFGLDRTWIVGQYTYSGTVVASENWGGPHSNQILRPALSESYEGQLHDLVLPLVLKSQQNKIDADLGPGRHGAETGETAFCFSTTPFVDSTKSKLSDDGCFAVATQTLINARQANDHIGKALVELLKPGSSRLQRWVGVSYKPDTERQSHYGELELARCYDQVVFIDRTEGLRPIQPKPTSSSFSSSSGPTASMGATRRLLKEYRRLYSNPPPGIEAHPLASNILEWHFVTRSDIEPYKGGEYHGILTFPPEYPNSPPRFVVLTPNGRFEPGERLCLSMSDYHKETWNPSWTVETLLVGLTSFMYEESDAIGSIQASASERRRLAAASHAFNLRDPVYNEVFGEAAQLERAGKPMAKHEETHESICRFCLSSGGKLIAPCMCKGSNEWVHLECLRDWQKRVLLDQPTHPKYQTSIDRICNICLEEFTGEGIPPSRTEQILQYAGRDLVAMVKRGNLLVSSREKSREYLELMQSHPEIRQNLSPWTKSVFLILFSSSQRMMAVSMSVPLNGPSAEAGLSSQASWALREQRAAGKGYRLRHWDGGPVSREQPHYLVHIPDASRIVPLRTKRPGYIIVPRDWVLGSRFDDIEEIVTKEFAARRAARSSTDKNPDPITINVVWGCGGWGENQIVAEIARGGWGLVASEAYLAIRPDPSIEMDWSLDFDWSRIVPLAKVAPPSEYSMVR